MHFIRPPYTVGPFNTGVAVILVAVPAAIGYVTGYVLAELWNWIHK
jgi:hypothetical protein